MDDGDLSSDSFSTNCSLENCTLDDSAFGDETQIRDWVAGIFLLIVCVTGLIGNSMVIFVVLRYAKMKTVTNLYILNLAIADDLFMIALIFLSVATLVGNKWIFGPVMCHVVFAIDGLNQFTSVFCLTAMSMDRYVAVCHARRVRGYRTLRLAICVNIGIWVLALAAASPMNIVTRYTATNKTMLCHFDFQSVFGDDYAVDLTQKLFMIYTSLMGFVIPLFIISVCYSSIVLRLKKIGARTGKMKKSRKVNRLVFFVVLAFFMCWWPFYVWRTVAVFVPSILRQWFNGLVSDFTMCLSYLNSCANPLLYGFVSGNFKKSFRKAWNCTQSTEVPNRQHRAPVNHM